MSRIPVPGIFRSRGDSKYPRFLRHLSRSGALFIRQLPHYRLIGRRSNLNYFAGAHDPYTRRHSWSINGRLEIRFGRLGSSISTSAFRGSGRIGRVARTIAINRDRFTRATSDNDGHLETSISFFVRLLLILLLLLLLLLSSSSFSFFSFSVIVPRPVPLLATYHLRGRRCNRIQFPIIPSSYARVREHRAATGSSNDPAA